MVGEFLNSFRGKFLKIFSETLEKAQMSADDVDLYVLHQSKCSINRTSCKKIKTPIEKFPTNLASVGNTSAASIPILLDELVRNQLITIGSGQKLLLSGFGGGLVLGKYDNQQFNYLEETNMTFEKIQEIITEQLGKEKEEVQLSTSLKDE